MVSSGTTHSIINLFGQLGIFGIIVAGVTLVARKSITQYFDKQLESHKVELQKEKYRFTELHSERGQVIKELYSKLNQFDNDMASLANPMQPKGELEMSEKLSQARDSGLSFKQYYERHRIFFSKDVCDKVDEFFSEMDSVFGDHWHYKLHDFDDDTLEDSEKRDKLMENWKKIDEGNIANVKADLRAEFREILGVDTADD